MAGEKYARKSHKQNQIWIDIDFSCYNFGDINFATKYVGDIFVTDSIVTIIENL